MNAYNLSGVEKVGIYNTSKSNVYIMILVYILT